MSDGEDVLSHLLAAYRSDRAVSARFTLSAPWSLASAGVEGMLVRMCAGAPYWIQVEGEAPVHVQPGDIVALPLGSAHVVASSPGLPPVPFQTLLQTHMVGLHGDHPIVFSHGGGGECTELYSLHVWMPATGIRPLLRGLPRLLLIQRSQIATTSALSLAMAALVDETIAQQPGWQACVARLADLLLVHVLRAHLGTQAQTRAGALQGMSDARISRAMARMHAQPAKAWSVEELASASGMSRTVFSQRFHALVGETPMQYLGAYRMAMAAQQLRTTRLSPAELAEFAGYDSEKSFARAFRRWAGVTPSVYARQQKVGRR